MQDPDTSHNKGAAIPPAGVVTDLMRGAPTAAAQAEQAVQHIHDLDFEIKAASFIRAYNELAEVILQDNIKKGFWPKNKQTRNVGETLMLVVTEIAECMEGDRKDLRDQHLPQYKSQEVELADAIIRIMDLGYGFEWQVAEALRAKLLYNRTREFKHGKKY